MGITAQFKDFNNLLICRNSSHNFNLFRLLETFVHSNFVVLSVDEDDEDDSSFDNTDSEYREKGLGTDNDDK